MNGNTIEIIGYKLIYPEYEKLVVKALGLSSIFSPNIIIRGMIGYYIPKIKDLEIMDWFEPVYNINTKLTMCEEKTIKLSLDTAKKLYLEGGAGKSFALDNYSEQELTKKELPKIWSELKIVGGYKISTTLNGSSVEKLPDLYNTKYEHKAIFATEKQAKSAVAMAKLSQLMAVYNDVWEPDWKNGAPDKWVIFAEANKIVSIYSFISRECFLAFKSKELRDEFLKNFEPLIKEYFMID